jgi:hypothetical protein
MSATAVGEMGKTGDLVCVQHVRKVHLNSYVGLYQSVLKETSYAKKSPS